MRKKESKLQVDKGSEQFTIVFVLPVLKLMDWLNNKTY